MSNYLGNKLEPYFVNNMGSVVKYQKDGTYQLMPGKKPVIIALLITNTCFAITYWYGYKMGKMVGEDKADYPTTPIADIKLPNFSDLNLPNFNDLKTKYGTPEVLVLTPEDEV